MNIVKNRKIFYALSVILVGASLAAIWMWGLKLGIDFKGGSILEINYPEGRPALSAVKAKVTPLHLEDSVRPTGEKGYIIRMRDLTEPEHAKILTALKIDPTKKLEEVRFDSIGPVLGKEATRKALISIIFVILAIVIFITIAFRKVSEPVSSWKYGIITVIALLHDVIVPTGVFALLGHLYGYEVDTLFVTAILVILGFSVHDTIVVFDRVRENLKHDHKSDFSTIVGTSIRQTFTRSINTSLTVLLSLAVLYFVGSVATRNFSLALIIGIITGTYSSIFLGSPLLVTVQKWQKKK